MRNCFLPAIIFLVAVITGPANAADRITVLLDWFVNPDHGPLIIADENGYFDDFGIDVELVAPADPSASAP